MEIFYTSCLVELNYKKTVCPKIKVIRNENEMNKPGFHLNIKTSQLM